MIRSDQDDVFKRAKETVDLLDFVEKMYNQKGIKQGKSYAFNRCPEPNCGEGPEGGNAFNVHGQLYKCYCCGNGGDVIKFAKLHWGCTALEAAKELVGEGTGNRPAIQLAAPRARVTPEEETKQQEALTQVLRIIKEKGLQDEPTCLAYLCGNGKDDRQLSRETVTEACRRNILRFLPADMKVSVRWLLENVGEPLLKQSGLWKEGKKVPGIVFRPIVFLMPGCTSAEFRLAHKPKDAKEKKGIHYGLKVYPWWWEGKRRNRVAVVEGAIDMLSLVDLGCECSIEALPGAATWTHKFDNWFAALHRNFGTSFILILDPDKTGLENTEAIRSRMHAENIPCVDRHPTGGDVNDHLRTQKATKAAA